jgi:hypothetical protein
MCGTTGKMYLLDIHWLKFKESIIVGSNNLAELMALKLTHRLAWDHGVRKV